MKKSATEKDAEHLVKVGGDIKNPLLSRRNIKIVLIACLLGALILVGVFFYLKKSEEKRTEWVPYDSKQLTTIKNTTQQANDLLKDGKTDKVVSLYDSRAAETTDTKAKSFIILSKATIFYNQKDYEQALKYALEAESYDKSWNVEKFIAEIYTMQGNKEKAIEYYNRSIEFNDPRIETYESDNKLSENMIRELSK